MTKSASNQRRLAEKLQQSAEIPCQCSGLNTVLRSKRHKCNSFKSSRLVNFFFFISVSSQQNISLLEDVCSHVQLNSGRSAYTHRQYVLQTSVGEERRLQLGLRRSAGDVLIWQRAQVRQLRSRDQRVVGTACEV